MPAAARGVPGAQPGSDSDGGDGDDVAALAAQALALLTAFLALLDAPPAAWQPLHSAAAAGSSPALSVARHAADAALFRVQSAVPAPPHVLWPLLAEPRLRVRWDSAVQEARVLARVAPLAAANARRERFAFGSVFMVMKPRLLHLLSLDVLLPPTAAHPVRLASLSTSLPHAPSATHTVFTISLSGFLLEGTADGAACRLTQLSHLGDAALWCPAAVVRLVASSLVPRSLKAVAKAALAYQPERGAAETFAAEVRDEQAGGADRRLPKSLDAIVAQVERLTAAAEPAVAEAESTALSSDLPADRPPVLSLTEAHDQPVAAAPSDELQAVQSELPASSIHADPHAGAQSRRDDEPSLRTESVPAEATREAIAAALSGPVVAEDHGPGSSEASTGTGAPDSSVEVEAIKAAEAGKAIGGEGAASASSPSSAPTSQAEAAPVLPRLRVTNAGEPDLTSERLDVVLRRMTRVLSFVEDDGPPHTDLHSAHDAPSTDQLPAEPEALQELLADAVHMQLQAEAVSRDASARPLSSAQQEAHRLSTMLLLGGDALALAIAPGAREAHAPAPLERAGDMSFTDETASAPSSPVLAAASSTPTASGSTTASSQRSQISTSSRQSALGTPATAISPHSSPALGSESGVSQAGSAASWGSSLAHAPYTLALGMMALSSVVFAPGKAEGSFVSGSDTADAACLSAARVALEAAARRSTASRGRQISAKPRTGRSPSPAPAASSASYSPSNVKLHPFPASLGKSSGGAVLPPLRLKARALERAPERDTLFEDDVRAQDPPQSAPQDADQQPSAAPGYVAWLASYLTPSR